MMQMQLFARLKKYDENTGVFEAIAADETPDKTNEVFDYESSKPHVLDWSGGIEKATDGKSCGNLRAMHDSKKVVGKLTELVCDDTAKSIRVVGKVVDPVEKLKFAEGCYSGVSIGGKYGKTWTDPSNPNLTRYTAIPSELSLADVPCNPAARFTIMKTDGGSEERSFSGLLKAQTLNQCWTCGIKGHEHKLKDEAAKCVSDTEKSLRAGHLIKDVRQEFADALGVDLTKLSAPADVPPVKEPATDVPPVKEPPQAAALPAGVTTMDDARKIATAAQNALNKATGTVQAAPAAPATTPFSIPPALSLGALSAASEAGKLQEVTLQRMAKLSSERMAIFEVQIKDCEKTPAGLEALLKKIEDGELDAKPVVKTEAPATEQPAAAETAPFEPPLETPSQVRAALSFVGKAKNHGKRTADEIKALVEKTLAAFKAKVNPAGPPVAKADSTAVQDVALRKGLYTVCSLANLLQDLQWLTGDYEQEQVWEKQPDSEAVRALMDARDLVAHALVLVVKEETAEITADADVLAMTQQIGDMTKASTEKVLAKAAVVKEPDAALRKQLDDAKAQITAVTAQGQSIRKVLELKPEDDVLKVVTENTAELKKLRAAPAAPKGNLLAVDKVADGGALVVKKEEPKPVTKADGTIDPEATAMNLIKSAHAGSPIFRPPGK